MGNRFDLLERAWPERKIFQGAASAYIRYTSRPQLAWTYLEQPLWKHVLSFFNSRTRMLDFGAGTGRITWEALRAGLRHYHIVAYEPNELLAREFGREVGMRCYRSRASTLSKSRWAKDGFTLITANMVFNHLDDAAYEDMVKESRVMLGPTGTLVYTIPHPIYKSMKYGFSSHMTGVVTEEEAPWGGYTQYHHRSAGHQDRVLQDYGFNTGYIECGYEDRLHGFQIEPYEENRNTHLRGPRRLMVVARKNVPIPERMLRPESIRPTTLMPYPINEHGASNPQELDMVEIKRKLYFEY